MVKAKVPNFFQNRKNLILTAIIVIILGLAFNFKSLFLAAVVNNQPITRYEIDKELERQGGQKVLENKIVEILILQKAQKQGVAIPPSDIDNKIKDIEKQIESQGQNLDTLLATQGQTRADLKKQIKFQLLIEKLVGGDIQINDQEMADYFQKNKNFFPKDATLENQKDQIKNELFQQKLGEKVATWVEDLKKEAKIYSFLKF